MEKVTRTQDEVTITQQWYGHATIRVETIKMLTEILLYSKRRIRSAR